MDVWACLKGLEARDRVTLFASSTEFESFSPKYESQTLPLESTLLVSQLVKIKFPYAFGNLKTAVQIAACDFNWAKPALNNNNNNNSNNNNNLDKKHSLEMRKVFILGAARLLR
jgi:hypothetical protein